MKYEEWSLGYWLLKKYVQFIDWIIYNKVIIHGVENLPKNKPIVFSPNHQNALSDPMAILLHTGYQPVWLARADIFNNKTAAAILRFLKIMPVYRMRDGKENLLRNEETFANSIKVLRNNIPLGLFPEAAHSGKRQMLAHKKAVPRIVFMAEEKSEKNLDIHIIPTGIYYSHYWKFNRNLVVNFGKPIRVNEFLDELKESEIAATQSLRSRILEEMQKVVLDIKSKNYYTDFENIREIYGKHYLRRLNKKYSVLNLFLSDKQMAEHLNAIEEQKPDVIEELVNTANIYSAKIKKLKLRTWLLEKSKNNWLKLGFNKLVLLLGFPVFLFGFIFNAIPFFIIDAITRKKIKDVGFWSTFYLVLGLILFPIFYLIEFFSVLWMIPELWQKLLILASMPFAGKLAFLWYILFRKTVGRARLLFMNIFNRKKYNDLLKEKEELYSKLDELIPV